MAREDDKLAAPGAGADPAASRRRVLTLGAVAASSVVTIRPALAQAAGSVLNCKIPIPDPAHDRQHIARDGTLVPADAPGSFAPPRRAPTGEEVRRMMNGTSPPDFDRDARQAYVNYVRRLQHGTSGFTCYASLQQPRP